jgi:hypothetical protein
VWQPTHLQTPIDLILGATVETLWRAVLGGKLQAAQVFEAVAVDTCTGDLGIGIA